MTSECVFVVILDGVRTQGSEWFAEEREGRFEQTDSGTDSTDDRQVKQDYPLKKTHKRYFKNKSTGKNE